MDGIGNQKRSGRVALSSRRRGGTDMPKTFIQAVPTICCTRSCHAVRCTPVHSAPPTIADSLHIAHAMRTTPFDLRILGRAACGVDSSAGWVGIAILDAPRASQRGKTNNNNHSRHGRGVVYVTTAARQAHAPLPEPACATHFQADHTVLLNKYL